MWPFGDGGATRPHLRDGGVEEFRGNQQSGHPQGLDQRSKMESLVY